MATAAEKRAQAQAEAAAQDAGTDDSTKPDPAGTDTPGDDGRSAEASADPTLRTGDAGQAEPVTDPATTDTAATVATATILSDTPAHDAVVAPRRYTVGTKADHALYGITDPSGVTTPTGNGGTDPLKPGERGNVLVAQGDTIGPRAAAILNRGA